MKYFISSGEMSGDLHASQIIRELKRMDSEASFTFLGGDHSANQAGVEPLIHIREMAVMGFGEVIRHLPEILGHLSKTKQMLEKWRPDAVILVDYPSFNLKLARFAKSIGLKVYWYISPKVWVWKEHRVKAMKKYIDRLFCILPFEKEYFKNKHNWTVDYAGNPSAEEISDFLKSPDLLNGEAFRKKYGINNDKPILALLPGSRVKEINSNLPIMVDVAKQHPEYQPVIATVASVNKLIYKETAGSIPMITDDSFNLLNNSVAALVTSGTATLETALLRVPQVMLYRHSGSKIIYKLFRRLLKVDYFSLPNLINNNETIKEFVMHYCIPENVENELNQILPGGSEHNRQIEQYEILSRNLGDSSPARYVAHEILGDIR